jgi:hypothetical protein
MRNDEIKKKKKLESFGLTRDSNHEIEITT